MRPQFWNILLELTAIHNLYFLKCCNLNLADVWILLYHCVFLGGFIDLVLKGDFFFQYFMALYQIQFFSRLWICLEIKTSLQGNCWVMTTLIKSTLWAQTDDWIFWNWFPNYRSAWYHSCEGVRRILLPIRKRWLVECQKWYPCPVHSTLFFSTPFNSSSVWGVTLPTFLKSLRKKSNQY